VSGSGSGSRRGTRSGSDPGCGSGSGLGPGRGEGIGGEIEVVMERNAIFLSRTFRCTCGGTRIVNPKLILVKNLYFTHHAELLFYEAAKVPKRSQRTRNPQ
jgi:hypothetical protein